MKTIDFNVPAFECMIKNKYLYVDKTEYLRSLITWKSPGIYLFTRPRRFGKTLTVSALEAIFQGEKELFKGLAIYNKYDWEQTHPVIRIDMSRHNSDSSQRFENSLARTFKNICTQYQVNVEISSDDITASFADLIEAIASSSKSNQVVVLVDEYDYPIIEKLYSKNLYEIIHILNSFYLPLKICSKYLRLVFITGISKFSHVSLLSGLNHLTDISMHPDYATMLGYTQKEVETYFSEHIDRATSYVPTSRTKLLKAIKEWYAGYRFCHEAESVYNPFSIAQFFNSPLYYFENYRYSSGTPTSLMNIVKSNRFDLTQDLSEPISASELDTMDIESLTLQTLLLQSGYLTIKKAPGNRKNLRYVLDFPNYEVGNSFYGNTTDGR